MVLDDAEQLLAVAGLWRKLSNLGALVAFVILGYWSQNVGFGLVGFEVAAICFIQFIRHHFIFSLRFQI